MTCHSKETFTPETHIHRPAHTHSFSQCMIENAVGFSRFLAARRPLGLECTTLARRSGWGCAKCSPGRGWRLPKCRDGARRLAECRGWALPERRLLWRRPCTTDNGFYSSALKGPDTHPGLCWCMYVCICVCADVCAVSMKGGTSLYKQTYHGSKTRLAGTCWTPPVKPIPLTLSLMAEQTCSSPFPLPICKTQLQGRPHLVPARQT